MSNLKLPKKKTLTSIRFDDETIEFMAKLGPVATVGRAIIEKAINHWPEFEKLAEDKSEA